MNRAYVAGIIDGEGCIGFTKARKTIFPRVMVANTNKELLEDLKEQFGGDVKPLSLRKNNWKQGYIWRLSWTRAVDFLDLIYDYLRLKDAQAATVFAWDAIRPGKGHKPTDEDREAVDFLLERMTWLNAKGTRTTVDPIEQYLEGR